MEKKSTPQPCQATCDESMSKLGDTAGVGGFWDAAARGDATVDLADPNTVDAEDGARRPARGRLTVSRHGATLPFQQEAAPARWHGLGGESHQQQGGDKGEGLLGARHEG
jgi:hypothetical protein